MPNKIEKYITDNPIFPVNDQLDQKEILAEQPKNRRNGGYEPTAKEIQDECEYLLSLTEK